MNKITPEHLARDAYVYVRQSTAHQLLNNPESRRRQYALVARAHALGWEHVIVVDDDLGRSGSGQLRPGFERLLAAICAGTAGAVLAIEASRLARNGRDWHTRRGADGRLEQDPDRRIRETLTMAFGKFGEIGSVRQLVLWLRQERIELPIAVHGPQ